MHTYIHTREHAYIHGYLQTCIQYITFIMRLICLSVFTCINLLFCESMLTRLNDFNYRCFNLFVDSCISNLEWYFIKCHGQIPAFDVTYLHFVPNKCDCWVHIDIFRKPYPEAELHILVKVKASLDEGQMTGQVCYDVISVCSMEIKHITLFARNVIFHQSKRE